MNPFPWPLLSPGDRVAVITPSGPPQPAALQRGCETLRSWGLLPICAPNVTTDRGMTAGTDQERRNDLEWALTDSDMAAVFCGRGGYGALRILDDVRWGRLRHVAPKPLVGFSDITVLHAALERNLGWPSVLGANIAGTTVDDPPSAISLASLHQLLFEGRLESLFTDEVRVISQGSVRHAPLFGGNLSMVAALAGTREGRRSRVPFVAVLEDVNEAPYRVDRLLTQLIRGGWFDRCVGVICGSWHGCYGLSASPSAPFTSSNARNELEEVLLERFDHIKGPIVLDAPFGHGKQNVAIPLGIPVCFDTFTRTCAYADF
jgi:muramoyltetrapeptide carboxypeptidase